MRVVAANAVRAIELVTAGGRLVRCDRDHEPADHRRPVLAATADPGHSEQIRGKSFVIVEAYHIGEPAQADELLAPLRELTRRSHPGPPPTCS